MKNTGTWPDDLYGEVPGSVKAAQTALELAAMLYRDAILACAPMPLLAFLWRQASTFDAAARAGNPVAQVEQYDVAMSMEYLHAVLSSYPPEAWGSDASGGGAQGVLRHAAAVRNASITYARLANKESYPDQLGQHAAELHYLALSTWMLSRAYRYGVLESEFVRFVLEPHSEALREAYGIDAEGIANGLQAAVAALIEPRWAKQLSSSGAAGTEANNVSRSSGLPPSLLADLSYEPGENGEFFAPGALCGTPLRTLPGRLKPLVRLADGHYACDPYFLRDSTYRAIQRALRKRLPRYDAKWTERQTAASEAGFANILARQLVGARILRSVHYYEVGTGKKCELDLLVALDDVLFVVEVKGGVMPVHSPGLDFDRYSAKVQELIKKAYDQGKRFLEYVASRRQVVLYQKRQGGRLEPAGTLRLDDYRHVFPIGLTIESFVPFSAASKLLPDVEPILGRFPFISMAIDDLFMLNRFLPTAGELVHYLAMRQRIAGTKEVSLVDEADHLGVYVRYGRFDIAADFYVSQGRKRIVVNHPSKPVDAYFDLEDWERATPPGQLFPRRFRQILAALDSGRCPGYLRADAIIRDLRDTMIAELEKHIEAELPRLQVEPFRRMVIVSAFPCALCLQRAEHVDVTNSHVAAAASAAKMSASGKCRLLIVHVRDGEICGAWGTIVDAPSPAGQDPRPVAAVSLRDRQDGPPGRPLRRGR